MDARLQLGIHNGRALEGVRVTRFNQALILAIQAHDGQVRKGTENATGLAIPYVMWVMPCLNASLPASQRPSGITPNSPASLPDGFIRHWIRLSSRHCWDYKPASSPSLVS